MKVITIVRLKIILKFKVTISKIYKIKELSLCNNRANLKDRNNR